uniref:Uncharacterized protein n=1 Tax=Anguilla anguilla TaxID=7936 RepID=A0A0E9RH06_ANGAN
MDSSSLCLLVPHYTAAIVRR